ncbi:hypothetical protein ACH5RR_037949 [Cinchona calisaya]|uniref:Uncharacterized protein n=1 Tax=Cinchona calisaya TaxID=153742 RepID=A0ABD2YCE2_9GENT
MTRSSFSEVWIRSPLNLANHESLSILARRDGFFPPPQDHDHQQQEEAAAPHDQPNNHHPINQENNPDDDDQKRAAIQEDFHFQVHQKDHHNNSAPSILIPDFDYHLFHQHLQENHDLQNNLDEEVVNIDLELGFKKPPTQIDDPHEEAVVYTGLELGLIKKPPRQQIDQNLEGLGAHTALELGFKKRQIDQNLEELCVHTNLELGFRTKPSSRIHLDDQDREVVYTSLELGSFYNNNNNREKAKVVDLQR